MNQDFSPLVSVGFPTYNKPAGLASTLKLLTRQTYRNLEIIVSDNCSPTPEVGEIIAEFQRRDSRIRSFRQETNIGVGENHKFVVRKATGELFLWLHDEDEIPLDYIERLVARFAGSPQMQLVGPAGQRLLDGDLHYWCENVSNVGLSTFARLKGLIPRAYNKPHLVEQYWYGLYRRRSLVESLWKTRGLPRDTEFCLVFQLSEKGFVDCATEVLYKKATTKRDLQRYRCLEDIHRTWLQKRLGGEVERGLAVTLSMLSVIVRSRRLTAQEKCILTMACLSRFGAVAVKDTRRRLALRSRLKELLRRVSG